VLIEERGGTRRCGRRDRDEDDGPRGPWHSGAMVPTPTSETSLR